MTGSSALTPEQQDWFLQRYGIRYTAVQEQHLRPSRRVRRSMKFGGNRRLSTHDGVVLQAQVDAHRALEHTRITKAVKPDGEH